MVSGTGKPLLFYKKDLCQPHDPRCHPFPILSVLRLDAMPSCDHRGASVKAKDKHTATVDEVEHWKDPGPLISLRSPQMLSTFQTDNPPL